MKCIVKIKRGNPRWVPVTHLPSYYLADLGQEDHGSRPAWENSSQHLPSAFSK
jgi:hypothetical protein